MMTSSKSKPWLWSLCRALAYENRLSVIQVLVESGEMCVSDVQSRIGMSRPNASNQLKILRERGLIAFRRESMQVFYFAKPPVPADHPVISVMNALKGCFKKQITLPELVNTATAFTHGRRIELVQGIEQTGAQAAELMKSSGMSKAALFRHLDKLERRDMICRNGTAWRLCPPRNPLAGALLAEALK
jgi:DNA-binding transcriptional ArsR family regulator